MLLAAVMPLQQPGQSLSFQPPGCVLHHAEVGTLVDVEARLDETEIAGEVDIALNGLVDYRSDNVPEIIMVVNRAHRVLDGEVRQKVALLNRRIAEFGAINLDGEI
jgi:hypothetical protein